jgi:GTPase Era involved in 16S rRNA processing
MPGLNKKPQMLGNSHVRAYLDSLSKADLADYVVDLLRVGHGDAALDDVELLAAIRDTIGPTLTVRGKNTSQEPVVAFFRSRARKLEALADKRNVAEEHNKKFRAAAEASRAVATALSKS